VPADFARYTRLSAWVQSPCVWQRQRRKRSRWYGLRRLSLCPITLLRVIREITIAFWVAGSFREKAILLVVCVGVIALMRGITELFLAFKLKGGPPGPSRSPEAAPPFIPGYHPDRVIRDGLPSALVSRTARLKEGTE
jgi:hypothetical protein